MKFSDIIGKEIEKKLLLSRVSNNAMPHAQLFVGKPGSGKLALVLATVQYMLCEAKSGNDSCGNCRSCSKTSKLIHPDVHFSFPVITLKPNSPPISNDFMDFWRSALIDNPYMSYLDWMNSIGAENKQGNITKEECRSVIQKLSLKPFEGRDKVLIMWLPEYLGKEGNSLLKLLEEPPNNTYFLLITEHPDGILPTILSRTQMMHVQPYSHEEIKQHLRSNYTDIDFETVAFLADGNIQAANHFASHTDNDLTESFKVWMRYSYKRNVPKLMAWSDEMGSKGREYIKNFLAYGLSITREILAFKTIPNYTVRMGSDEQHFVTNFSGVVQFANIEVLYKGFNDCIAQIERNANPKLTLFHLSLTLRDSFYETHKA